MGRFAEKLMRFFAGRYGVDTLGKCLLVVYLVIVVVNSFVGFWPLLIVELGVLALWMWRVLSRNIPARVRENDWFLTHTTGVRQWGRLQKNRWRDRKTHVYRTCPHCKAVVRLPKSKRGRRTCNCPRCRQEFAVRI